MISFRSETIAVVEGDSGVCEERLTYCPDRETSSSKMTMTGLTSPPLPALATGAIAGAVKLSASCS